MAVLNRRFVNLSTAACVFTSMALLCVETGCSSQGSQQASPLVATLDLRTLGYRFTTSGGSVAPNYTGLCFVSEDRVVVSINQIVDDEASHQLLAENSRGVVITVNAQTGRVLMKSSMPLEQYPSPIKPVLGWRLAVWNHQGLQLCSENMQCGAPIPGPGPFSVSPRGSTIVFGEFSRSAIKVLTVDNFLSKVAQYDEPDDFFGPAVIPGDGALLVARSSTKFAIQRQGKADKLMDFDKGGSFGVSSFLNDEIFAYLRHSSSEAIVADLDGRELHRYKLDKVHRAAFLPAAGGNRFGIYEYGYTFWNSVFNFTDLDDTRPPNFQRVRVIDLASREEIGRVEWNPLQGSRYIVQPCLSPSGHRLARIKQGVLEILQVN
jgi:hypothetical protein